MTPEMSVKLRRSLIAHEGYSNHLYTDSVGKQTIGIGYNITDRGLPDDVINSQYQQDVSYFYQQLSTFTWFHNLNIDRQIVLVDMCFMGFKKFLSFKKMIQAIERGDYETAADEMLDSKWSEQVKSRAHDLAEGIRTGIYNI